MEMFVFDDEVARLDAVLSSLCDAARLAVLVPLSWHLRQRDTRRALVLADEAEALLTLFLLPGVERQRIAARLHLVRGEANWLFAELDAAEAQARIALQAFTVLDDAIGCIDAHWLLGFIASDFGNSSRRDAALETMSAVACQVGDSLRREVAEAGLAFFAVSRDHRAEMHRRNRIGILSINSHPAVLTWAYAFQGRSAFGSRDFERAVACGIRVYEAALATGQVRDAIGSAIMVGVALVNLNDFHASLDWMRRGLDLARSTGWAMSIGWCLTQTAKTLRLLGRVDAAQELIGEALDTLEPFADTHNYSLVLQYCGDLALERGDYAAALGTFLQLAQRADTLTQSRFQFEARRGLDTPITLVSALGQGSTFAIDLPRAARQTDAAAPAQTPATDHETLRNKLIVVVDDEASILDAMRVLLEQWSCAVVTAASGREAIAKLDVDDRLPDALICDYRLRLNETGLDVVKAVREELRQEIPTLLVTGDTATEQMQDMRASGLPVLHKPVQAGALRDALVQLLRDR